MTSYDLPACPDDCPICTHPKIEAAVERAIDRCRNPDEIVKTHACGMKYTREQWDALKFGWFFTDDDAGRLLETRLCARCLSHIAIVLGPSRKVA